MNGKIKDVLIELGIDQTYVGYQYLCDAMELVLADETSLYCVSKSVWRPLEERHHYQNKSIESGVRTAAQHAWRKNPERMKDLLDETLDRPPAAAEFLALLYNYIVRAGDVQEQADGRNGKSGVSSRSADG